MIFSYFNVFQMPGCPASDACLGCFDDAETTKKFLLTEPRWSKWYAIQPVRLAKWYVFHVFSWNNIFKYFEVFSSKIFDGIREHDIFDYFRQCCCFYMFVNVFHLLLRFIRVDRSASKTERLWNIVESAKVGTKAWVSRSWHTGWLPCSKLWSKARAGPAARAHGNE